MVLAARPELRAWIRQAAREIAVLAMLLDALRQLNAIGALLAHATGDNCVIVIQYGIGTMAARHFHRPAPASPRGCQKNHPQRDDP
jgi:hypothetical protein